MSKLNSKTLTIAAALLMVLALLVMATPLLGAASGFSNRPGFNQQLPRGNPGQLNPGQGFPGGQDGSSLQGFPDNQNGQGTPMQFPGGGRNGLRLGLLSGMTRTIVYAVALLVSLAAAAGMFLTRRWGQILGAIMAVVYLLLALVSFIPLLLMTRFMGLTSPLNLGLNILHLVLAVAVFVLALIPAKKLATPIAPVAPPAAAA